MVFYPEPIQSLIIRNLLSGSLFPEPSMQSFISRVGILHFSSDLFFFLETSPDGFV